MKNLRFKSPDFKSLLLIFLLPFFVNDLTQATFYDRKAEGWHWYEDRYQKSKTRDQKKNPQIVDEQRKATRKEDDPRKEEVPQDDPILHLEAFKKEVDRLKAIAILSPTYQNVKAYMEIQKELMDRATRFAQKWVEVVYTTPRLDYTLKHPTSQAARHVYLDQQHAQLEKDIRALSERYGLFFFYSSQCPYCKEFASIVKSFSEKYGWEVLPISLDGDILPEFPKSKMDNGTAKTLGVQSVPTLLAVEPRSGKVIPLSRGMSAHDQIEDRIRVLIIKRGNL